jgi:hypothetical protein
MKNSLIAIAIGFFALAAVVAINTIIGIAMFYSSAEQGGDPLYFQYSLLWNPFGYWLIILSLLAFGLVAQIAYDYHEYVYNSKVPWTSPSLLYCIAALLFFASVGDIIFQIFVELTARGQLALASVRQSEYGMSQATDRSMLMRIFPYNLMQYVVPIGHALTGMMLISAAQRITLIRLEAEQIEDASETSTGE